MAKDEPLRARYFLTRENGQMVPLIAIDELPPNLVVDGVPRELSALDIAGMTCVGVVPSRSRLHNIQKVDDSSDTSLKTENFQDERHQESGFPASVSFVASVAHTPILRQLSAPADVQTESQHQGSIITTATPSVKATPTLMAPPPPPSLSSSSSSSSKHAVVTSTSKSAYKPGEKEYCTYWMSKGECNFTQQGCMYKHEMPLDAETLAKCGFSDIPAWYRRVHGLGSYLATPGSGAAFATGRGLKSSVATGVNGVPVGHGMGENTGGGKNRSGGRRMLEWRSESDGVTRRTGHGHGRGRGGRRGGGVARSHNNPHGHKGIAVHAGVDVNAVGIGDVKTRPTQRQVDTKIVNDVTDADADVSSTATSSGSAESSRRRGRILSIASEASDIEADLLRSDSERRRRESDTVSEKLVFAESAKAVEYGRMVAGERSGKAERA